MKIARQKSELHGLFRSQGALYKCWANMKNRCYLETHPQYPNYGGRGILVCERWVNSFKNFFDDMGPRPTGMSIDRIDNNGPYSPQNCRWATRAQQQANTRMAVLLEHSGEKLPKQAWAKRIGISNSTLNKRLKRMSVNEAISRPKGAPTFLNRSLAQRVRRERERKGIL